MQKERTGNFGGYPPPLYPSGTSMLNRLYKERRQTDEDLAGIGKQLRSTLGFQMLQHLPSDQAGDTWYAGMQFKLNSGGEVFVTFPFHSEPEISIAFHCRNTSDEDISGVVEQLRHHLATS